MNPSVPDVTPTNLCPRCGVAFTCGMRAGEAACWCAAYPAAFAVPAAESVPDSGACYCPTCLAELIETRRAASGR
jgi:hypothetical protein